MDQFSDRLKTVLSDPEAMAKIGEMARSFAAAPPSPQGTEALAAPTTAGEENPLRELVRQPAIAAALKLLGDGSRERVALLQAMRPFVREEKREKLDHILQTMRMLDLISSAQKFI